MEIETKEVTAATGAKHSYVKKIPDLSVKWSVAEVIPDNDVRPDEAKATMEGDTTYPTNRDNAEMQIWAEHKHANVETVSKLKLDANKIVTKNTTDRPFKTFTLDDGLWEPFDKLKYHFTAKVDTAEKETITALKVKRWHVQAINTAERAAILAFRNQESANYDSSFASATDDAHHSWAFDAGNSSKSDFGKMMKNTYSFNYTGHGVVICGTCNAFYDSISTAGPDYGGWTTCSHDASHSDPKSTHCIGSAPFLQSSDIKSSATVPSVPKYLMYSVCCGGAFETSLYDAYIARGTQYAIGFEKSTRCDWARDYSKQLYDSWIQNHNADPDKLCDVYNSLYSTWSVKLAPRMFGRYWGAGTKLRELGRSVAALF